MSAKLRLSNNLEAVVTQRPDGVFAAGSGTEVGAGDQHLGTPMTARWFSTNSGS